MKKSFAAVIIFLLAVAVALYLFFRPKNPAPQASDLISSQNSSGNQTGNSVVRGSSNVSANPSPVPDAISNPASPNPVTPENVVAKAGQFFPETNAVADLPAKTVLENVRRAVRQYGEMFGGNPVGVNSEITAALAGKNPKGINFIDPSAGMRVNANGEMVDAWGTPYFFHQISGTEMEIHSAGPDKVMWTSDDLITR